MTAMFPSHYMGTFGTKLLFILCSVSYINCCLSNNNNKIVSGDLKTDYNWKFIASFPFKSDHGRFMYDVRYDASYAVQKIGLYYDTESQWPRVFGDTADLKTCREKESVLKTENNQFINLTTKIYQSNCFKELDSASQKEYIRCNGTRNFNTARERWWHFTVSNCDSNKGLQLQ